MGSRLLGWRTKCAVEIDAYARSVLLARQRDGHLEPFPIWDDVCTFDGRPWRGSIDVISGGFPCQDIAACGKGAGITGARSGLFFEMLRIVKEVQPRFVFAENSPNLRTRGLQEVIEGLDRLGYDVRWCVLGAWHVGAPHKRNRMWVLGHRSNAAGQQKPLAHPNSARQQQPQRPDAEEWRRAINFGEASNVGNTQGLGLQKHTRPLGVLSQELTAIERSGSLLAHSASVGSSRSGEFVKPLHTTPKGERKADQFIGLGFDQVWAIEPDVGRVANGVAARVDRLRAIGNGQVPAVAVLAFEILSAGLITGSESSTKHETYATSAAQQHKEDANG